METQDKLITVIRFKTSSHSFCLKKYIRNRKLWEFRGIEAARDNRLIWCGQIWGLWRRRDLCQSQPCVLQWEKYSLETRSWGGNRTTRFMLITLSDLNQEPKSDLIKIRTQNKIQSKLEILNKYKCDKSHDSIIRSPYFNYLLRWQCVSLPMYI